MQYRTKQEGYMTLLAVLITGSVALAASVAILMSGISNSQIVAQYTSSAIARGYGRTCAEAALFAVHENQTYTGTGTDTGCNYTVTSQGVNSYKIDVYSNYNESSRRVVIYAQYSGASLGVTSWKEVP